MGPMALSTATAGDTASGLAALPPTTKERKRPSHPPGFGPSPSWSWRSFVVVVVHDPHGLQDVRVVVELFSMFIFW